MTQLPSGWTEVTLGDVCEIVSGATPKTSVESYWGGPIRWATPKDLSDLGARRYLIDTPRTLTEDGLRSCGARILPAGSVLFSSRAPVGLTAINRVPVATNQGFKSLVPSPNVDAEYLYWWLSANRRRMEHLGRGATFKEVSKAIVAEVSIPLPPLEEQRRIAAILDKADELRAKRRAASEQLESLTQVIFHDMFGDPVTNSMKWPEGKSLGDVAAVVSGITKGRRTSAPTRAVPYLSVANVQDKQLLLDSVKDIGATEAEVERYRLHPGDVLLTEGGDPDKLGRGTVWREELPEAIHQNHIFRVRPDTTTVTPDFLAWLVGSERGKRYFLKSAKQTTGIASINATQLRAFPLLLPPLERQRDFDSLVAKVRAARERADHADDELARLAISLQSRAFRGEL